MILVRVWQAGFVFVAGTWALVNAYERVRGRPVAPRSAWVLVFLVAVSWPLWLAAAPFLGEDEES